LEVSPSQRSGKEIESAPALFGEEEKDVDVYKYATHFRRQLTVRSLKSGS
jgi:hypothetical protein